MVTRISAKQGQVKPKSAKQKAALRTRRARLTPRQRFARLRPNERAALLDFVERLRAKFGDRVQHVILYGSRARGQGDAESDLDVLVVLDQVAEPDDQSIGEAALGIIMEYDNALLSPRVWALERFEMYRRDGLLLYRNIKRDGIELWTTPGKLN